MPLDWYTGTGLDPADPVDLASVKAVEIGISGEVNRGERFAEDKGKLHLDVWSAAGRADVALAPAYFTCPTDHIAVRGRIAADLLARHRQSISAKAHPLVPSWFEEPTPLFWVYTEALALLVFTLEAKRTGNTAYRDAVAAIADRLGSPADFSGGDGWNTAWHGIAPGAWVYFALAGGVLG